MSYGRTEDDSSVVYSAAAADPDFGGWVDSGERWVVFTSGSAEDMRERLEALRLERPQDFAVAPSEHSLAELDRVMNHIVAEFETDGLSPVSWSRSENPAHVRISVMDRNPVKAVVKTIEVRAQHGCLVSLDFGERPFVDT